jgi:hypothetical protein
MPTLMTLHGVLLLLLIKLKVLGIQMEKVWEFGMISVRNQALLIMATLEK